MTLVEDSTNQPVLTAEQAAKQAGVNVRTWHAYVARGTAPPPDGHLARTPYWYEDTVTEWLNSRRGTQ